MRAMLALRCSGVCLSVIDFCGHTQLLGIPVCLGHDEGLRRASTEAYKCLSYSQRADLLGQPRVVGVQPAGGCGCHCSIREPKADLGLSISSHDVRQVAWLLCGEDHGQPFAAAFAD